MVKAKYVPSKEAEAILDGYRLLDDNFMTLFFDQNFEATALMLNVILGRNDIQILRMEVQKVEKSPSADGRSVVLDIFAVDSSGKHYDIEVQRADHGADKKRARFLSGVLDSRMLKASGALGVGHEKLNPFAVCQILAASSSGSWFFNSDQTSHQQA